MKTLRLGRLILAAATLASTFVVHAAVPENGTGVWAVENDPAAMEIIESERQWALDACVPGSLKPEFIADDFAGTDPRGVVYAKAALFSKDAAAEPEHNCKLLSAKVRFFGPDLAVAYGSESGAAKGADGKDQIRVLVWTDTLVRRGGKWQVIAVQDMVGPPQ
jgi:hypothetical protein